MNVSYLIFVNSQQISQLSLIFKCLLQNRYKYNMHPKFKLEASPARLTLITILLVIHLGNSAQIKQLSTQCLCDTSNSCDHECCCDSQCPAQLKVMLGNYNRCDDDNYGIPLCQNINATDVNYDDLYSGLKTIYTVVKRLFCVSRINVVDPTTYYRQQRVSSQPSLTSAITKTDALIARSTTKPANVASLGFLSIAGVFYRSSIGVCSVTNSITVGLGTKGAQQCKALLSPSTISTNAFLSVTQITNKFANIKIYSMNEASSISPNIVSSASTTCNSLTCQNVVRYLKLFINPSTNNIAISYALIGTIQLPSQSPAYITVKYDYEYLSTNSNFANVSTVGYQIGSPLKLLKKDTTNNNFYKIFNPINLAYRNSNGNCRTDVNDNSDQSLIELRLGINQFHSCIGSKSFLYQNLKNSFDFIAKTGSSNNVLGDYVQIIWNTASDTNNVLLKIDYVKIGASSNPQYYVVRGTVSQINPNANSLERVLFVQFQQISTTANIFIPDPPKVDAYLPNDFLYPFYVAA